MPVKRWIVVPCGTSLRESLCWKSLPGRLDMQRNEYTRSTLDNYSLRQRVRDEVGEILRGDNPASDFDRQCWDHSLSAGGKPRAQPLELGRMSAELGTLRLIAARQGRPFNGDDLVELFCSDDTVREGQVLREIMVTHTLLGAEGPEISLAKVPSLDANDAWKYTKGLDELRRRFLRDDGTAVHADRDVLMCLTGGYKGTVSLLTVLAVELRRCGLGVKAYYLYEGSPELIELPLSAKDAARVVVDRQA